MSGVLDLHEKVSRSSKAVLVLTVQPMDQLTGGYASASSSSSSEGEEELENIEDGYNSDEFRIVSITPAPPSLKLGGAGVVETNRNSPILYPSKLEAQSSMPGATGVTSDVQFGPARAPSARCPTPDTGALSAPVSDAEQISPAEKPDAEAPSSNEMLAKWISDALQLRERQGLLFNATLRRNSMFQNPALCSKMVTYCDVEEYGSFCTRGPLDEDRRLLEGGFYDVLSDRQRRAAEDNAVHRDGKPGLLAPK